MERKFLGIFTNYLRVEMFNKDNVILCHTYTFSLHNNNI